jgi:polysaccharide pyruvyl transferase WcaK-like protein
MKTFLLSARYSDNLGDGVIGDCLEWMIRRIRPGNEIIHMDVAARREFSPRDATKVSPAKRVFYSLPMPLRPLAVLLAWPLQRSRLSSAWEETLSSRHRPGQVCAIVAGGQLISDVALNFPLKINFASRQLSSIKCPVAIFAVGASSEISPLGRRLFQRAFDQIDLRWVGARDRDSLKNLQAFELKPEPRLTIDPAVWAKDAYQIGRKVDQGNVVGIGIAHPDELSAHVSEGASLARDDFVEFVRALVGHISPYCKTVLFNNGSAEDELFTKYIASKLYSNGFEIEVAARPETPRALVETISQFDVVVAHRLHSNIIGFSFGIPTIGMRWDKKVESFFMESGRSDYFLPFLDAAAAGDLIRRAISRTDAEADQERLQKLKSFAMTELELLIQAVEK